LGKDFTEKFRSGGGRRRRSPAGGAREERGGSGREERRIDEREETRPLSNRYVQKGANEAGALPSHVVRTRVHMESLGHHQTWRTMKDRRRRPEGRGEWEPIKIPYRNLVYIPKLTRSPSLLTQPRLPSYRQAINPRNRVRNHNGNTTQCRQGHV
jgi:hypothetical protein